jgi:hypothetical protein
VCALAGAESAQAGTLSKANGEYVFAEADGDTTNNVVVLYYCAGTECGEPGPYFLVRDAEEAISDGGHGCTPFTDPTYLKCADVSVTSWRLALGAGNDQVLPQTVTPFPVPLNVDGGAGSDGLNGSPQADSLAGGPGSDTLIGLGGDDLLNGGTDDDVLNGGLGTDTASYATRSVGVSVDLGAPGADDGSSEDGSAGSRDTHDSVENVIGGAGADELRGTADANRLDGGAGDDTLNALAGQDTLLGGSGIDNVQARDGEADSVDCGPDEDGATTDAIDTRVNCDSPPPEAETVVVTLPAPPAPPAPPARLVADLGYTFVAGRRATTLRNLALEAEPGARLRARCRTARGQRCTGTRDLARATAARELRLRGFEAKPLPVGAKLTIQVTKAGMIGAVKTLTIRRRKAPTVRTLCLPPGATRPAAC